MLSGRALFCSVVFEFPGLSLVSACNLPTHCQLPHFFLEGVMCRYSFRKTHSTLVIAVPLKGNTPYRLRLLSKVVLLSIFLSEFGAKYQRAIWRDHRWVQQWRGDRKQDFERTLKSGETLSYNLKSFCAAFETNYVFQFKIRRGQAEAYVYPEGLKAYGVSVDSFAITKIEDAL